MNHSLIASAIAMSTSGVIIAGISMARRFDQGEAHTVKGNREAAECNQPLKRQTHAFTII